MITIDNVTKRFQTQDGNWFYCGRTDIASTIQQGEILLDVLFRRQIHLLRLINLIERPDSGTVTIDGKGADLAVHPRFAPCPSKSSGWFFQQFNLMANVPVAQTIAFAPEIAGWLKAAIMPRVMECLEIVDGQSCQPLSRPASGGSKTAGIARALAPKSPMYARRWAHLSLSTLRQQNQCLACLMDINEKFNVTIDCDPWNVRDSQAVCNRVALADKGKLLGSRWRTFNKFMPPRWLGNC